MRQFHVRDDETITAEYTLGRKAPMSSLVDSGQASVVDVGAVGKMLVLHWADGTLCDLSQTPREVRIEVMITPSSHRTHTLTKG